MRNKHTPVHLKCVLHESWVHIVDTSAKLVVLLRDGRRYRFCLQRDGRGGRRAHASILFPCKLASVIHTYVARICIGEKARPGQTEDIHNKPGFQNCLDSASGSFSSKAPPSGFSFVSLYMTYVHRTHISVALASVSLGRYQQLHPRLLPRFALINTPRPPASRPREHGDSPNLSPDPKPAALYMPVTTVYALALLLPVATCPDFYYAVAGCILSTRPRCRSRSGSGGDESEIKWGSVESCPSSRSSAS